MIYSLSRSKVANVFPPSRACAHTFRIPLLIATAKCRQRKKYTNCVAPGAWCGLFLKIPLNKPRRQLVFNSPLIYLSVRAVRDRPDYPSASICAFRINGNTLRHVCASAFVRPQSLAVRVAREKITFAKYKYCLNGAHTHNRSRRAVLNVRVAACGEQFVCKDTYTVHTHITHTRVQNWMVFLAKTLSWSFSPSRQNIDEDENTLCAGKYDDVVLFTACIYIVWCGFFLYAVYWICWLLVGSRKGNDSKLHNTSSK